MCNKHVAHEQTVETGAVQLRLRRVTVWRATGVSQSSSTVVFCPHPQSANLSVVRDVRCLRLLFYRTYLFGNIY